MTQLRILSAISLVCWLPAYGQLGTPQESSDAIVSEIAPEVPASPQLFTHKGGNLAFFLEQKKEVLKLAGFTLIATPDAGKIEIPEFRLKPRNIKQLAWLITEISEGQLTYSVPPMGFETSTVVFKTSPHEKPKPRTGRGLSAFGGGGDDFAGDFGARAVRKTKAPNMTLPSSPKRSLSQVRVYSLKDYLGDYAGQPGGPSDRLIMQRLDNLGTLISRTFKYASMETPENSVHRETRTLIVVGTQKQQEVIANIVAALAD